MILETLKDAQFCELQDRLQEAIEGVLTDFDLDKSQISYLLVARDEIDHAADASYISVSNTIKKYTHQLAISYLKSEGIIRHNPENN